MTHSNPLPKAPSPFHTIHSNLLLINPPARQGYCYVLVLIDDLSCFNWIYVIQNKNKAKSHILAYFNEIRNQFNRFPAVFHSNRGAKRFNQTLLTKLRCMMAQSNIPVTYWDEAARFLPFGLKVAVHQRSNQCKVTPVTRDLLFVRYEPRSNAARFLDPAKGVIMVS